MNTTTLFVEIVIIGVQVSLWLVCFVLAVSLEVVKPLLDRLIIEKEWMTPLLIVVFAIAYPLGIAVDRFSDKRFRTSDENRAKVDQRKYDRLSETGKVKRDLQRMMIYMQEGRVTTLIDYPRSRLRIARATTYNAILIGISVGMFIVLQHQHVSLDIWPAVGVALVVLLLGCVLSLLSTEAAIEVQVTEDVRTELITRLLPHKQKDSWTLNNQQLDELSAEIAKNAAKGNQLAKNADEVDKTTPR